CGSEKSATPKSLRGATNDGTPRVTKGKITQIGAAPSSIALGEVKPASSELIQFGQDQLDYYEKGLKFAAEQTNCWSNQNPDALGNKEQWGLNNIERLNDASLPISPDLTYNPAAPRADRSLGIVDFVGEDGEMLSVKFNPVRRLRRNVMGGMYFMHANDGVIIYFYRPADLPGLISSLGFDPKSQEFLAYIQYATFLQDQVITPLLTAPKKTTPKRKSEKNNQASPDSKTKNQKIQKASKKPVKLKDDFALGKWRGSHGKHQSNFKTKKTDTRDKLEFIDLIYKSEEQLTNAKAPHPAKPLPPKSSFDFELGKGKTGGKPKTKNLTGLFDWMRLWSGEPIDFLGRFRDKFGGAFVRIANKFNTLKKKLSAKFKSAHKKHSPSGKSYGTIAVRAFWAALLRSSTEVFDNTAHLLAMSLESGLKEKMKDIMPVEGEEFAKMVEEGFPQLKEMLAKVDSLENDFAAHVDEVLLQFESEINTIKEIADKAEKYGKIIKLAMIAIQCGTPPGWGCAKLLASRLIAELVDQIMQWCSTQKEFNNIVASTGILDGLPKKLATYTADTFEKVVPGIAPIFDRNVFDTAVFPPPANIPCDEGPEDVHLAYLELEEEIKNRLGEDGYFFFMMSVDKYGIKSDTELSASEIRDMKNSIPKDITTEDFQRFLASDFKPVEGGTTFNSAEFLVAIRESRLPDNYAWFYVAHPPSQGHTKGETVQADVTISLYQPSTEWTPVMKLTVPAKVLRRISTKKHGLKIYYQPLHDVPFNFFGYVFTI
ncbi:MAG TPA: hypothetical protein VFM60_01305, partial [Salinimicrobium sp.]|nr:hypothetical protein [Salinimicrobium sp.]